MPLYEYHCSKCGKNFDVIQKFSDAPLTEHEGCGGAVEKMMSAPSFHLKGGGWYVTEYGKGGKIPAAAPAEGKAEDKKSGEASSESKPAEAKASESKTDASGSDAKVKPKTETKPAATPSKAD
jgi:putative FmdB family regulatory protein